MEKFHKMSNAGLNVIHGLCRGSVYDDRQKFDKPSPFQCGFYTNGEEFFNFCPPPKPGGLRASAAVVAPNNDGDEIPTSQPDFIQPPALLTASVCKEQNIVV